MKQIKKTYSQPSLMAWNVGTKDGYMFNPASNPDLPNNPGTPDVGVKQEWSVEEEIWDSSFDD